MPLKAHSRVKRAAYHSNTDWRLLFGVSREKNNFFERIKDQTISYYSYSKA